MNQSVINAEEALKAKNFREAGRWFEKAAQTEKDSKTILSLLRQSAQAYEQVRETEDAVNCYIKGSQFLQGTEKVECLLAGWKLYVMSIAGYQWDCCFEFQGDDRHDDDHEINQELIRECRTKGENLLRMAWEVEGANRDTILREVRDECQKRKQEGGWGEQACRDMLETVTGNKIP